MTTTSPRVQLVWCHPRTDSFTAEVVAAVRDELTSSGAAVDEIDLYRDGFDPALGTADEPDWSDPDKHYSPEVMAHAARARSADGVVFVFPVWWYSLPAMLKGYIDRVWNHGIFYGDGRQSGIRFVRWVGVAGEVEASFVKRGHDAMMAHHLNSGIAGFCGIGDSRLELLFGTIDEGIGDEAFVERLDALLAQARRVVAELDL